MEVILSANNLFKSFDKKKENTLDIIKDISLEVEKNKITLIVGASGAGKSTLLHILSGLDKPDKGIVKINDQELSSLSDDKLSTFRNEKIGFVFQFHHLLPEFTALENISIPQMINGKAKKTADERSFELLDLVGIKERYDHKPAELSGGEQQRVAIARALSNSPDIIFADEPTGNLDSKNSTQIHNLFLKLKEEIGATFLMVTHNPELIKLADRVLEIKDGKLLER